jgi:hypothetical protein
VTPAELLRQAAANITDATWCQGALHEGAQSCAIGHLQRAAAATGINELFCATFAIADAVAPQYLGAWNDDEHRTAADVKALFLRVADELEAAQ